MVGVAQVNSIDPMCMSAYSYSKVFLCVKLYKLFKSGDLMSFFLKLCYYFGQKLFTRNKFDLLNSDMFAQLHRIYCEPKA